MCVLLVSYLCFYKFVGNIEMTMTVTWNALIFDKVCAVIVCQIFFCRWPPSYPVNNNFVPSIWSHKHSCGSGHVSRRRQEGPSIGSPVFCFPWLERECPPCLSIRTSTQTKNMHTDKHIKGQANKQTNKNTGLVLALLCFAFPGLESALSVNNRALPLRTHTLIMRQTARQCPFYISFI